MNAEFDSVEDASSDPLVRWLSTFALAASVVSFLGSLIPIWGAAATAVCTPALVTGAAALLLAWHKRWRRSPAFKALLFAGVGSFVANCQQSCLAQ